MATLPYLYRIPHRPKALVMLRTRSTLLLLLATLLITACELPGNADSVEEEAMPPNEEDAALPEADGHADTSTTSSDTLPAETPAGFVVHEWGTFTSMQASDGHNLDGLHHTEELLPDFVHGRDRRLFAHTKSLESLPEPVTQKLETPVLYFYNDTPLTAHVQVDFPQGVISEWFPDASAFGPEINALTGISDGTMTWDVDLTHDDASLSLPAVAPDDIWAPSRRVPEAMCASFGEEHEKFIFYRGLGRFDLPITVSSNDTTLTIQNPSDDTIPDLFLIHVHDAGGAIVPLGTLDPHATLTASPSPKEIDLDAYVEDAASQLQAALVRSGLFPDEARAMVDTWRHSYFRTPGLRLLYVVPRSWTDALLPITIEPRPDALVRTLVGRVEILLLTEETTLLSDFQSPSKPSLDALALATHNRFIEPRLHRLLELTDDPETQAHINNLLSSLAESRATTQP